MVYKVFLTHWEFSEGLSGCVGRGRFTILSSVRLNMLLALYLFRKMSQEEMGEGRFYGEYNSSGIYAFSVFRVHPRHIALSCF